MLEWECMTKSETSDVKKRQVLENTLQNGLKEEARVKQRAMIYKLLQARS